MQGERKTQIFVKELGRSTKTGDMLRETEQAGGAVESFYANCQKIAQAGSACLPKRHWTWGFDQRGELPAM